MSSRPPASGSSYPRLPASSSGGHFIPGSDNNMAVGSLTAAVSGYSTLSRKSVAANMSGHMQGGGGGLGGGVDGGGNRNSFPAYSTLNR